LKSPSTSECPHIRVAIASSAGRELYKLKTDDISEPKACLANDCCVFGDDPGMKDRNEKLAPDILLAKNELKEVFIANGEPQFTHGDEEKSYFPWRGILCLDNQARMLQNLENFPI
jgi:hypothetical protein